MCTITPLREIVIRGLNTISANALRTVGKGRIVDSVEYKEWKDAFITLLPDNFLLRRAVGSWAIGIEVRIRYSADLDNTLKAIIDGLKIKYQQDDSKLTFLVAKKIIRDTANNEEPCIRIMLIDDMVFGNAGPDNTTDIMDKQQINKLNALTMALDAKKHPGRIPIV